ncbi:hypothetical protein FDECE_2565 [Fusarium decemcellulare]|nr:hypothetical protein FDECE_2565 [Fusarium decemcellulare]
MPGNSSHAGDAVDCISRLVTSIVCEHDLSLPELRSNLGFYTNLETGRWKTVNQDLKREQQKTPKHKSIPKASDIVGRHINDNSALEIAVSVGITTEKTTSENPKPFVGAKVMFGKETQLGLDLWSFCDDTLCFFPAETEYQRWGMSYLGSWPQFLIHISYQDQTDEVSGLWWQLDSARDGIWFHRVSFEGQGKGGEHALDTYPYHLKSYIS